MNSMRPGHGQVTISHDPATDNLPTSGRGAGRDPAGAPLHGLRRLRRGDAEALGDHLVHDLVGAGADALQTGVAERAADTGVSRHVARAAVHLEARVDEAVLTPGPQYFFAIEISATGYSPCCSRHTVA